MLLDTIQNIYRSLKGYYFWKRVSENYNMNDTIFFLLYPGEEYLLKYMKKNVFWYMQEKRVFNVVILCRKNSITTNMKDNFTRYGNICFKYVELEILRDLLMLYRYTAISDRVMVISLSKLKGRRLENLIGKNNASIEEIISGALFTLKINNKRVIKDGKRINWTFRLQNLSNKNR